MGGITCIFLLVILDFRIKRTLNEKGIFYMARPVSGVDCIRMLSHIKILETEVDEIYHLSTTKTDNSRKTMEHHSGLRINKSLKPLWRKL